MSDTPRTDSEAFLPHDSKYKVCDDDFARQLERELNAANAEIEEKRKDVVWLATEKAKLENRIKRLEEQLMDAKNKHAVLIADVVLNEDRAEQIKRLREANLQLREGAEEQKQRIQRLEEVGDWMRYNSNNEWWCGNWDEAKESK